ncbi:hypothetical protein D3C71_152910 [compost metagenome]
MMLFETMCGEVLANAVTLVEVSPELDRRSALGKAVDQTLMQISHPIAIAQMILEEPDILGWKAPEGSVVDPYRSGAEYIRAAVRSRIERRLEVEAA